jgi:predicted NAD/FAD-dependent oxidoreductase
MSPKVLVVGCGITGSAVNRYLTTLFPALKPSYTFWEKSSGVGGRMITNYLETAKIDSKASSELQYLAPHCDMGAQYLTRSSDNAESLIYSLLNDAGVIAPIVDNTAISGMRPEHLIKTHYVASNGLSSVIDYLSKGSNSDIENVFSYDTTLESITVKYCAEKNSNIYAAVGSKLGSKVEDSFDTVILTLPAPQLLALEGDVVGMLGNDFRKQLGNVVYSSRFVFIALSFSKRLFRLLSCEIHSNR